MTTTGATMPEGAEIMARLYPGDPTTGPARQFLTLPNTRDPRMFMPASARLAAQAFRRARRTTTPRDRAQAVLASAFLRAGGGRLLRTSVWLPIAGSVEETLCDLLGQPVTAAVFLGPRRANRKPVLQVLDRRGDLVAMAKVGIDGLTSDLARNEARALRRVHATPLSLVVAPSLLAEHTWDGHAMVVQSPLDIPPTSTVLDEDLVSRAMVEISRVGGVRHAALGESTYLPRLRARVEAMTHPRARAHGLMALDELAADDAPLAFGMWHGDLTRWNLCTVGSSVLVWDWERCADDVPLGFDSLHHVFLPSLAGTGPRDSAGLDLLAGAEALLRPHEVPVDRCSAVTLLYLLEIASRFSGDGQAATGKAAGDVDSWLLPALASARPGGR